MTPPTGLPPQPMEVKDFSGGVTDFYLQGAPNRARKLTNFLIDPDKMLYVRPGSAPFDRVGNHLLPGVGRRVDDFYLLQGKTKLLANQGRSLYALTPGWTELLGPSGNAAFSSATPYQAVSGGEFSGVTYLASSAGALPVKVYSDENATLQVRTAGLPAPRVAEPAELLLLLSCIDLANAIRQSMLAHISDTTLHYLADKRALQCFVAQTFTSADPFYNDPSITGYTPAPAATDKESLLTLVAALKRAYNLHGSDLSGGTFVDEVNHADHYSYHGLGLYIGTQFNGPTGPFQTLSDESDPPDLEVAAAELNLLYTRWNWHRLSINSHGTSNDYATIEQHPIGGQKIDLEPLANVDANKDYISFANYLKFLYNRHATSNVNVPSWYKYPGYNGTHFWGAQTFAGVNGLSVDQTCTLPDATDNDSASLIIYWVWALYGYSHLKDADNGSTLATTTVADYTAGSNAISNVGGGSPDTLSVDQLVITPVGYVFEDGTRASRVVSAVSGSAVLEKKAAFTSATITTGVISWYTAQYHSYFTASGGTPANSSETHVKAAERLDPTPGYGLGGGNDTLPATLADWVNRGIEVITALQEHMANDEIHTSAEYFMYFYIANGAFSQDPVQPAFFKPSFADYGYALVWKQSFTTEDGLVREVRSAPAFSNIISTGRVNPLGFQESIGFTINRPETQYFNDPLFPSGQRSSAFTVTLENLPVLENDSVTNYATDELKLEIYRTADDGNTYYLIGEVDNGTTTFTDEVSDTVEVNGEPALQDRVSLYTTGGVVANSAPLPSKFLHIVQNKAYYGYVTDTGETFKGRVLQSVPDIMDAVPPTFSVDIEDELTGISSTRNAVVLLGLHSLYRLTGGFNLLGQGSMGTEAISNTVGCISPGSVVQTELGILFAGTDGFYYTDGFQLIKISIDLDSTYQYRTRTRAQQLKIKGTYDKHARMVWWTMQSEATSTDANETWIFHMNYGIKPNGVFTVASNGVDFQPSALTFFNGDLVRGSPQGFVFRHNPLYLTDPKIPSNWEAPLYEWEYKHIPYEYASCALDFGTTFRGQWVTKVHLMGPNAGNANIQMHAVANNRWQGEKQLAPVRYTKNMRWGDPTVSWGDADSVWDYSGSLDVWRRFPAGNLRAQLKEIRITPARIGVYRYDDYPEGAYVTIDPEQKTAIFVQPEGWTDIVWPTDVVGMYLALESDDYVEEFEIVTRIGDTVYVSDPDSQLVPGAYKWVVRGYMKEAGFQMSSYVIHFAELGFRGKDYTGAEGRGENT